MIQFLSIDEVLESHAEQIATYVGSDRVRDAGLLDSAIAHPRAMFAGKYLHVDIFESSCCLWRLENEFSGYRELLAKV